MSDDWTHFLEFMQGCFRFFYDNLREGDGRHNQHIIWSDNCTQHSRLLGCSFGWVGCMWQVECNIFKIPLRQEEHGKGEYDGARACVKRALSREELKYEGGTMLKYAKIIVK